MQRSYNISQTQERIKLFISLTHEVGHNLAHGGSKDEVLEDAGDEGEGHAEHRHHQVADRQREQEGVGDGAHALIDRQHHDDEQVANYAEEEDERVEQDPQCVVPVCHTMGGERQFYMRVNIIMLSPLAASSLYSRVRAITSATDKVIQGLKKEKVKQEEDI